MQMRSSLTMIVPSWRDFPGRVIRLAAAALLVSTAMSVPRGPVGEYRVPEPPQTSAVTSTP
jgi:hypothetical protein